MIDRAIMGKRNKRKGGNREREVKKILEKEGYKCVKAGGSLGIYDIIAIPTMQMLKDGYKYLGVQVKSNYIRPGERELIEEDDTALLKQIRIKKDFAREWIIETWNDVECKWVK